MPDFLTGNTNQVAEYPREVSGVGDAVVLAYNHIDNGGNGLKPYGVAICFLNRKVRPEFVTWRLYMDEDHTWHAEMGHYMTSIHDAYEDYNERVARGY